MKNWYQKNVEEVKGELKTDIQSGLSDEKIKEAREKYGFNELKAKKKKSLIVKFV